MPLGFFLLSFTGSRSNVKSGFLSFLDSRPMLSGFYLVLLVCHISSRSNVILPASVISPLGFRFGSRSICYISGFRCSFPIGPRSSLSGILSFWPRSIYCRAIYCAPRFLLLGLTVLLGLVNLGWASSSHVSPSIVCLLSRLS
jgi:hypothetical protein